MTSITKKNNKYQLQYSWCLKHQWYFKTAAQYTQSRSPNHSEKTMRYLYLS